MEDVGKAKMDSSFCPQPFLIRSFSIPSGIVSQLLLNPLTEANNG